MINLNSLFSMLNEEQQQAKELIEEFIENGQGFFGLLGSGGTGKTFVMTNFEDAEDYQYLAPTNKAVNVLRNGLKKNGILIPNVKTIDSFFSLRMKKDEKNETIYSYRQPKFDNKKPKVIVVDECSMLTIKHVELLTNLTPKIPIVLIGDEMQLPPVELESFIDVDGFKKSIAFSCINQTFKLTKQNRQSIESDLFKLINGFRNNMEKRMDAKKIAEVKNNGKDIFYFKQNSTEFETFIKENKCVSITFKNNTSDYFNYKIGSVISNNKRYNIKEINKGDEVVFNSFYFKEDVTFYTSEKIKIVDVFNENVTIEIPEINVKVQCVQTKAIVKNEIGIDKVIWLKNSDLRDLVWKRIYYHKNKTTNKVLLSKLNTFYNDFKNGFADLKKPYSMTSHKSQGSTFENIIVPVYDFYKKEHKDANQLFYVAISRASKKIVFVDGICNFNKSTKRVLFTEEERYLIASSQNWNCNICETELTDAKFEIDHIYRLGYVDDKGKVKGNNDLSNLQAICKTCHKEKTKTEKQ